MTATSPVAQPDTVTVRFSSGGLAFASRGQPRALLDAEAAVSTRGQRVLVVGQSPRPWKFEAADSAELRAAIAPLRWRLRWSPEDVGAFAAMAMWTYVNMPFLLANGDVESTRRGDRVVVRFPPDMVTHSPRQVLHLDEDGLIRRHDYTALAFGRWAVATQRLSDYESFDGLLVPTRRVVTPRFLPAPTLVWIALAAFSTAPAAGENAEK